jgi:hypothetical protein
MQHLGVFTEDVVFHVFLPAVRSELNGNLESRRPVTEMPPCKAALLPLRQEKAYLWSESAVCVQYLFFKLVDSASILC